MNLSNIDAWQYIVAFASPYLIAFINRPDWTVKTQRWVMVAAAVVIALVTAFIEGSFTNFNISQILQYLVLMIGATQLSYTALKSLKPTSAALDKATVKFSGVSSLGEARQKKAEAAQASINEFVQNTAGMKVPEAPNNAA